MGSPSKIDWQYRKNVGALGFNVRLISPKKHELDPEHAYVLAVVSATRNPGFSNISDAGLHGHPSERLAKSFDPLLKHYQNRNARQSSFTTNLRSYTGFLLWRGKVVAEPK
jgi:hypothetical protein